MEYAESAKILEVVIKKNKDNQEILQMLVDSYYYNSQMKDAYKWYPILMEKYEAKVSPEEYFKYSQVLKAVNKNEEADSWFQKYIHEKVLRKISKVYNQIYNIHIYTFYSENP